MIAESEEESISKIKRWKKGFVAKGMKVNAAKSKVMVSSIGTGKVAVSGNFPCGVCSKGMAQGRKLSSLYVVSSLGASQVVWSEREPSSNPSLLHM